MTDDREDRRPRLRSGEAFIDDALARSLLPKRPFAAHKWGVGGLVIVAGAPGYIGAPALCARSAGRSGAGIVTLAVPRGVASSIAVHVPEATYVLLPESDAPGAVRQAIEKIGKALDKATAIVIGPGLGDDAAADTLLAALFGLSGRPTSIGFRSGATARASDGSDAEDHRPLVARGAPAVIDADGLNWLAKRNDWAESLSAAQLVLTPHPGELGRLLDVPTADLFDDPVRTTREAAKKWQQTVVFKYGYTVVSDGSRTLVADDALRSLATAGTGDVLAGAIGAFLAQGLPPVDAAALGVYVGSRAARRVERRFGTLGLVASDLPDAIAEVLGALEAGSGGENA